MVFYEYERSDGQRIERDFPMGTAPEAIRVEGRVYRRRFSLQRPKSSRPIVGYAVPDKRTMPPELAAKVDRWTAEGTAVFDSPARAREFSTESKRLHAAGVTGQEWHFGDVPTGAEVRAEEQAKVKKYREDMLKRPRPKNL